MFFLPIDKQLRGQSRRDGDEKDERDEKTADQVAAGSNNRSKLSMLELGNQTTYGDNCGH